MKRRLYTGFLIMILFVLSACDKEEIMNYEENPGVYFDNAFWTESMLKDVVRDTIMLPVSITGTVRDYDRKVKVEAVLDTNTTATPDLYEFLEGTVKAGAWVGSVPVILKNAPILADTVLKVRVKIAPSEDFTEIRLGIYQCDVAFTTKVIQPANWRWLRYYFGTPFSTCWWNFIVKHTGQTSFPYYPGQDPEIWWMSVGEVQAYAHIVKRALYEYNSDPKNEGPLTHDDGPYAGTPVTMP